MKREGIFVSILFGGIILLIAWTALGMRRGGSVAVAASPVPETGLMPAYFASNQPTDRGMAYPLTSISELLPTRDVGQVGQVAQANWWSNCGCSTVN